METTKFLQDRAEEGDSDALFRLGFRLAFGRNRPRPTDWSAVFPQWKRAAEAGDAGAQRDLGYCYHEGECVPIDFTAALYWYRKAAKSGDAKACYNLALSYRNGDGVKVSERWSRYWLQKAAARGHRKAKKMVEE